MVETQKQRLRELAGAGLSIAWVPDLNAIPVDSITGVFLSNELVDAFPVHRVVKRPLGLREIFVGWESPMPPAVSGRFVESDSPPCSPSVEACFARLGINLAVYQQLDLHMQ